MEFLRQLFHGKGYIDGITIINLDGEILFSAKLNSKFSNRKGREAYQALVGQKFFDVFENLNAKNSSMIRAMERKFSSLDALTAQIGRDAARTREYFKEAEI